MAGVAHRLAAEQIVATLFLRGQRSGGAVGQPGVEFRRERANAGGDFIGRNGLGKFVEGLAGASAVRRTETQWSGVGTECSSAFRSAANRSDVGRPRDFQ